jgi:hypothetical protein
MNMQFSFSRYIVYNDQNIPNDDKQPTDKYIVMELLEYFHPFRSIC